MIRAGEKTVIGAMSRNAVLTHLFLAMKVPAARQSAAESR